MKIPAMVATVAMAAAGAASARNIEVHTGTVVPVCVETLNSNDWGRMSQAEGIASKMFAAAELTIRWQSRESCPADGIRISLSLHSGESDHPHAFAYALPVEGVHIVLFWDRITNAGERALPYLAAHVLVHEVTHILQGVSRHSDSGVMKAIFTGTDIEDMQTHPLPFTTEDLQLIQQGIEARRARTAQ